MCGLSRLARYNVTAESLSGGTGKVKYFEGTPIPTSVVPLGIAMAVFHWGNLDPVRVPVFDAPLHLAVIPFLISGGLMISKTIHIPKP
jgi:CDP-diacylglycerol--serine O-phosphatidyltransferase